MVTTSLGNSRKVFKWPWFSQAPMFTIDLFLKSSVEWHRHTMAKFEREKNPMIPDLEDPPYTEQEATQAQLGPANPKHGFGLCWAFSSIPRAILLLPSPYTVESGENHMTRMTAAPLKSQNLLQLMMCFYFKICQVVFFFLFAICWLTHMKVSSFTHEPLWINIQLLRRKDRETIRRFVSWDRALSTSERLRYFRTLIVQISLSKAPKFKSYLRQIECVH